MLIGELRIVDKRPVLKPLGHVDPHLSRLLPKQLKCFDMVRTLRRDSEDFEADWLTIWPKRDAI